MTRSKVSEITRNMQGFFRAASEHDKKVEHETGLTGQQLWVLRLVAEYGPVKISDLVCRTRLHPTTVGGMLDRLEAKGLLERRRSTTDRRVVRVELTAPGKELFLRAEKIDRDRLQTGLSRLSGERLENIAVALTDIMEILGVPTMYNDTP